MSDLISRQDAIDEIRGYKTAPDISDDETKIEGYNDGLEMAISILSDLSSTEPERTVNVKRVSYDETMIYETDGECECGKCVDALWDYCPSCGAKLKWGKK